MDPNPSSCTCFVLKFYGVGVKMVRAVLTLWSRETNIEPQRSLSDLDKYILPFWTNTFAIWPNTILSIQTTFSNVSPLR